MKKYLVKPLLIIKSLGRFLFYKKRRLCVKNNNFTIFSNNCIGGCIYHSLNEKFSSPTINCYMNTTDFLKFLLNYKKYLKQNLIFHRHKVVSFPVASLGDLTIYFNHYKNDQEALESWDRRKTRINESNMYAIIREIGEDYFFTKETISQLLKIYKNIVIITFNPNKKKLRYYKYINLKGIKDEFQKNFYGIDLWERKWNYVPFLNKKRKMLLNNIVR